MDKTRIAAIHDGSTPGRPAIVNLYPNEAPEDLADPPHTHLSLGTFGPAGSASLVRAVSQDGVNNNLPPEYRKVRETAVKLMAFLYATAYETDAEKWAITNDDDRTKINTLLPDIKKSTERYVKLMYLSDGMVAFIWEIAVFHHQHKTANVPELYDLDDGARIYALDFYFTKAVRRHILGPVDQAVEFKRVFQRPLLKTLVQRLFFVAADSILTDSTLKKSRPSEPVPKVDKGLALEKLRQCARKFRSDNKNDFPLPPELPAPHSLHYKPMKKRVQNSTAEEWLEQGFVDDD